MVLFLMLMPMPEHCAGTVNYKKGLAGFKIELQGIQKKYIIFVISQNDLS